MKTVPARSNEAGHQPNSQICTGGFSLSGHWQYMIRALRMPVVCTTVQGEAWVLGLMFSQGLPL